MEDMETELSTGISLKDFNQKKDSHEERNESLAEKTEANGNEETKKSSSSIQDMILSKFRQVNEEIQKKNEEKACKPTPKPYQMKFKNARGNRRGRGGFRNFDRDNRKRQFYSDNRNEIHIGLKEADVGITEYVSEFKGFSGIIKHRFSDFQVHEIDKQGNVVELTSTELPELPEEEPPLENYKDILTPEQWEELEKIVEEDSPDLEAPFTTIDVSGLSKKERGHIHKVVKYVYGPKLYSNTKTRKIDDGWQTYIEIGKCQKHADRMRWPKDQGQFLHFVCFKENMDTATIVSMISQKLRTKPNSISYAGIKDKRAKTTQRMCIKLRRAEELKNINQFIRQATFGNFSYKYQAIRLGDLTGNKFSLAIRNVEESDEEIVKGLESLKKNGFINYFGMQRFGSSIVAPTYSIGKAILLTNWQEAVNLILKPRFGEKTTYDLQKCRQVWAETSNAAAALKELHRMDASIEASLLRALKTQRNQFFNALFAIPRNCMLLYLHSYQSLIWNKVVSRRIKTFGMKVLPGDLVYETGQAEEIENQEKPAEDKSSQKEKGEEGQEGDESEEDDDDDDEDNIIIEKDLPHRNLKVRKLTAEEAEKTEFSEVVYPLPGNDIQFPDNEIAGWYNEILAEDGLAMEHFEKCNKSFSLCGTYRKAVSSVSNLTWQIINYSNHTDDLILSDVDRMKTVSLKSQEEGGKSLKFKGIILNFDLPPSNYATMLLRELMKCDTTTSFHAKWSKQNNEEEPNKKKQKTNEVTNEEKEVTNEEPMQTEESEKLTEIKTEL